MLSSTIKTQLAQYGAMIENEVVITVSNSADETMLEFIAEVAKSSKAITIKKAKLPLAQSFKLGERITFACTPVGNEFTPFIKSLLNAAKVRTTPQETIDQVVKLGKANFITYINVNCQYSPGTVNTLNIIAEANPKITHTIIDIMIYKDEILKNDITETPTTFKDGVFLDAGKLSIDEIITLYKKPR